MPEVVQVVHRQDARAGTGEDFKQQPVNVLEFAHKLIEQRGVVIAASRFGLEGRRHVFQRARDVKNYALPPELSFRHRLPVPREPLVAGAFRPDVGKALRLLLVTQQFRFEIGIAKILHLETLVLVEGGQQETELILKCVQIRYRAVQEVGRLEDKSLRHVASAPKVVEHDQVANKVTVGSALEHSQLFACATTGVAASSLTRSPNSRTQMRVTCGSSTLDSLLGGGTTRMRTTWPKRSSCASKSRRQPSSVTTAAGYSNVSWSGGLLVSLSFSGFIERMLGNAGAVGIRTEAASAKDIFKPIAVVAWRLSLSQSEDVSEAKGQRHERD